MDETLKIWESLHKNGYYEGITLAEEIRQSWARSRSFGADPYKPRCDVVLSAAELQERKKNNSALLEQATVMMKYLDQFMRDTNFVFFLEDSENYIIST
ncbi:MAG: sigma-54-dependent Fis family transcriptional regulator, partial [Syntrophomonadaceae bacterium]|nr:sigma-54-dependent Fis family transcriptional regulator [Syntrophomonadaceae bacterium]